DPGDDPQLYNVRHGRKPHRLCRVGPDAAPIGDECVASAQHRAYRQWAAANRLLYGHLECGTTSSHDQGVLLPVARSRKAGESRAVCRGAETAPYRLDGGHKGSMV